MTLYPAGMPASSRAWARPFPLSTLAIALGSALTSVGTMAQESPSSNTLAPVTVSGEALSPTGRLNLDTTSETASRLGLTSRETPASVTVVDRSTIDARGAQDTQEILRAIPGVTAHNAPGSIGVFYRGFTGASLSQLFNGINVQYSIAARPVDSWIYDRVEAIGGASGFLYGAGAVGGTINYITKLPERSDFSEAQLRLGSNSLREVSVGFNRRLSGDASGTSGNFFRLDLNHRDSKGPTDGTKSNSTQLATSLLSDFGGGWRHTLAYEYQKEYVDRPYWGTPVLNPIVGELRIDPGVRFNNYNSTDGIYSQEVHWLRSVTEWEANDALQFKNTLFGYHATRDYRNVETYRYNANNTGVIRSSTLLQRHAHNMVGDRLDGTYKGMLGGMKSDWAFGVEASVNRQTRFPNSIAGNVSTVDPYNFSTEAFFSISGTSAVFSPDRDNKVTTLAGYLENRTSILPDVSLVTGLRHERIDLNLTNRRAVTAAAPASFSRSYAPTTGRIGLVWDVTPGANFYAQYSTAADPPSGILTTASFADVANNSALTTGRQIEVGSKFDFWDKKGNATVSVYRINRQNISTQDPNNTTLTILVGEQTAQGVEVAVGLQPTPRWSVQGNLTYVDARYKQLVQGGVSLAGNTPTNTPQSVANLWSSYAFSQNWTGIVGVRMVSKVFADAANTLTAPGYTLLDLGLNYKVSKSVSIVGRVRNATDRIYFANAGTTQVYLGAPRTVDISLRASF